MNIYHMYEEICKYLQDLSDSSKKLCEEFKEKDAEAARKKAEQEKTSTWKIVSWVILGFTVVLSVVALCVVPNLYGHVYSNGEKSISTEKNYLSVIQGPLPSDVFLTETDIRTRKSLSYEDQVHLSSLVDKENDNYTAYQKLVNQLAYESNNMSIQDMCYLLFLTFCFVFLGCTSRTLYDYIGRVCYMKSHDMSIWWPWYTFRPVIGAPIAAFLIVASRCAMFSTLFTSRDLNTYLVVSFLAGFAMMEFLSFLRSVSKGLFEKNGR